MLPEAIESLKKASTISSPEASRAYSELGFAYYDMARYQDAVEAADRALNIDPVNLDAILESALGEMVPWFGG